jgi:rSAM/selenodomain-associated transferase 2
VFPIISLITSAPVTFSGAGLREGAALFFLGLYHIPAEDAVAAALLVLVVYLSWAMLASVLLWRGQAEQEESSDLAHPRTISVIIPTLNEIRALPETIASVKAVPQVLEILVVDGGSQDGTAALAAELGCRVLRAARSRGAQLRCGAEQARGDVLLLLHADTWVPPDAGQALLNCLRDRAVVGGAFWKTFREKNLLMSGSRFRCGLRLFCFRRVLGDQAMFVRRPVLESIGGIPNVALMEEFELCRRLRRFGRLALAGATVSTSARRFAKRGVVRTYLRMWHVTARYYLGAPPHKLQQIYDRD